MILYYGCILLKYGYACKISYEDIKREEVLILDLLFYSFLFISTYFMSEQEMFNFQLYEFSFSWKVHVLFFVGCLGASFKHMLGSADVLLIGLYMSYGVMFLPLFIFAASGGITYMIISKRKRSFFLPFLLSAEGGVFLWLALVR